MPIRDWDSILSFVSSEINTPDERRFAISQFIPDLIEDGFNQTNSLQLFQRYGLGISYYDYRDIYRAYSKKTEMYSRWNNLDKTNYVPDDLITIGDIKESDEYRYVANVTYTDKESRRFALGEFGLKTSEWLTIEEAEDRFRYNLAERYQVEPDDLRDVRLVRVVYHPKALF